MAKLAVDPDALGGFLRDPETTMAESRIEEGDRDLIRNSQLEALFDRLSIDLWSGHDVAPETVAFAASNSSGNTLSEGAPKGSLVVVGTGIRSLGQLTVESIAHIKYADRVHYLVAEPIAVEVIRLLNPAGSRSLADLYEDGKPRRSTYQQMVDRILESMRSGLRTCAVFYGHPGVFVDPSHAAIRTARAEGFRAEMLPGISAEDCMFADLGIDPATAGCQSYEATDFLVNRRQFDPTSHVVIWQAGVLGDRTFSIRVSKSSALDLLVARLLETYPPEHQVCIYQAATVPGCLAGIRWSELGQLDKSKLSIISTLYLPPARPPRIDLDLYFALSGLGPPVE